MEKEKTQKKRGKKTKKTFSEYRKYFQRGQKLTWLGGKNNLIRSVQMLSLAELVVKCWGLHRHLLLCEMSPMLDEGSRGKDSVLTLGVLLLLVVTEIVLEVVLVLGLMAMFRLVVMVER